MKLNFEGLGEFSNQNDFERCVLVPKMTISIHVNAKNNLDRDLGQFCFLFIPRPEDLGRFLDIQSSTCLVHFNLWDIDQGTTMGPLPPTCGPSMSIQAPESAHD